MDQNPATITYVGDAYLVHLVQICVQGVSFKTQPDVPSCIPTAHHDHNVRFLLQRVPNNEHSILWLVEV